jgi:isocitrate/isopropylmalate dehydrogenase
MREGILLLLAATAALAACSSSKEAAVDPNIVPSDYRREILNTFRKSLDYPANVRDAAISDPVLRSAGQDQRYSICVRENSRDVSGQYRGVREHIGWFYGGHLNQLVEATPGQCAGAAYRPWPELEKLCQATKCE